MNTPATSAAAIIQLVWYATLATVSPDAQPSIAPVYVAYDSHLNFYWSSNPTAQHSQNIAANGRLSIVIYGSLPHDYKGKGVYLTAHGEEVMNSAERARALRLLGARRSRPYQHPEKYEVGGPQRVYKATPITLWLNDAERDAEGDLVKDIN